MATKNCPHCQKQVPVACKKCGCGHVFFSSRRNVGREGTATESLASANEVPKEEKEIESEILPRRRTGRVQREKPNFYDALQYENQIRKQKLLLRKVKSKSDDTGSEETPKVKETLLKREHDTDVGGSGSGLKSQTLKGSSTIDEAEPKKRRRGRPPGITGRKPGGGARIHHNAMTLSNIGEGNQDGGSKFTKEEEEEDIMADISPEKALQYNIVLQEINRKWAIAGWKAP